MHTVTCSQCPRTFTKSTKNKAECAVRMHVGRAHNHSINPSRSRAVKATGNGYSGVVVAEPVAEPVADRRSRAWRAANPKLAKRIGVRRSGRPATQTGRRVERSANREAVGTVVFNHCPGCGCDLKITAEGIAISQVMRAVPGIRAAIMTLIGKV